MAKLNHFKRHMVECFLCTNKNRFYIFYVADFKRSIYPCHTIILMMIMIVIHLLVQYLAVKFYFALLF